MTLTFDTSFNKIILNHIRIYENPKKKMPHDFSTKFLEVETYVEVAT